MEANIYVQSKRNYLFPDPRFMTIFIYTGKCWFLLMVTLNMCKLSESVFIYFRKK